MNIAFYTIIYEGMLQNLIFIKSVANMDIRYNIMYGITKEINES